MSGLNLSIAYFVSALTSGDRNGEIKPLKLHLQVTEFPSGTVSHRELPKTCVSLSNIKQFKSEARPVVGFGKPTITELIFTI
mmetsp:Transcript_7824/g.7687  ORF Transcript_7824/g.7687 Transcript_7824/m.7687 type:complete len:82 (+) Transcript_7824:153-398(+)